MVNLGWIQSKRGKVTLEMDINVNNVRKALRISLLDLINVFCASKRCYSAFVYARIIVADG